MPAGTVQLPPDTVGHVVHFYGGDGELVERVSAYLLGVLQGAGVGIMVATPAHRLAVQARIAAADVDVAAALASGKLLVLDAAETVHRFLLDGCPDPAGFNSVIGDLIRPATEAGRPVRVYGEMVAVLWQAGQVTAAIELEGLWNELGRRLSFSLLCAYPAQAVAGGDSADALRELCYRHSAVLGAAAGLAVPPAVPGGVEETVRTFGRALDAPRAARHFVVETLQRWGNHLLVDDAALVVTELATNAVLHAYSGFTVIISHAPDAIRISVRDSSPVPPRRLPASSVARSGRGLVMVAAVASRWAVEPRGFGKVVWAELPR